MSARTPRSAPPAARDGSLNQRFTRLEPRDGLVIDAEAWSLAHHYHDQTMTSHNLAAHGVGVLAGLDVVPAAGREIGVLPGVAIDPAGRLLVVTSLVRLEIDPTTAQSGRAIVILAGVESESDENGRIHEEATVRVVATPTQTFTIELARIDLGAQGNFRFPTIPEQPRPGEIDTRFRMIAGGHARGMVTIADLQLPDAGTGHEFGGALLTRAINADGHFRAQYLGQFTVGEILPDATILYVSGTTNFSITEGLADWLRNYIQNGGTLIGDGCHATPADQFGTSFDRLATTMGRQLKRVVNGDHLLWSHHLFGAPPPGLIETEIGLLLATDGIVYCASDYGCVLKGGGEPPASRGAIRAIEEFATNFASEARQRALAQSLME